MSHKPSAPLGIHELPDGTIVNFRRNREGRGAYTLRLVDGVRWDYEPGLRWSISEETKMPAERAAQIGLATGVCVRCLIPLTDPRSVAVGYGSTCARNEGWVYPKLAEVRALRAATPAVRELAASEDICPRTMPIAERVELAEQLLA